MLVRRSWRGESSEESMHMFEEGGVAIILAIDHVNLYVEFYKTKNGGFVSMCARTHLYITWKADENFIYALAS